LAIEYIYMNMNTLREKKWCYIFSTRFLGKPNSSQRYSTPPRNTELRSWDGASASWRPLLMRCRSVFAVWSAGLSQFFGATHPIFRVDPVDHHFSHFFKSNPSVDHHIYPEMAIFVPAQVPGILALLRCESRIERWLLTPAWW
jgi:hypothetical protein